MKSVNKSINNPPIAVSDLPRPLPIQPEEMEVLAPRPRLSVSEWAEKKRILSDMTTDLSGPWSHEYTPFLIEPMDMLSDVGTRQVTIMACTQSGKTEVMLNFLGRSIDEAPGPALIVMPTEADTIRRMGTRIRPMFESTPSLRAHLPRGRADNLNIGKESILDNMILYIGWSGSPAALADNPVCYIGLDEVGKFPAAAGREGDPVGLAKKRSRTFYWRSKLYVGSTPVTEDDLIDREFKLGDQREDWVKCVNCGQRHVMEWKYVDLKKDAMGNLYPPGDYAHGGLSYYTCPECGAVWSERDRWQAVADGRWSPKGTTVDSAGRIVGESPNTVHHSYHIKAMMLHPHFQTIDHLAAEWAEAQIAKKVGDIGPLQNFINSQLAESWKESEKQTQAEVLRTHIGNYESGICPPGVQVLTMGIDVQLDHMWIMVIGWGYMSEAWSIIEMRLETGDTSNLANYERLADSLAMAWPLHENDRTLTVSKAAIDCQYNADTVIDFCRKCTFVDIVPVRGDDSVKKQLYRSVKLAGGLMTRYDLNVTVLKDRLYRLMTAVAPGPGYFHLNADTTEETLAHLSSEEQRPIRHGRRVIYLWDKKQSHLANHLWDCAVYATFAAEIAGVRMIRDPSAPPINRSRRVAVMSQYRH